MFENETLDIMIREPVTITYYNYTNVMFMVSTSIILSQDLIFERSRDRVS